MGGKGVKRGKKKGGRGGAVGHVVQEADTWQIIEPTMTSGTLSRIKQKAILVAHTPISLFLLVAFLTFFTSKNTWDPPIRGITRLN